MGRDVTSRIHQPKIKPQHSTKRVISMTSIIFLSVIAAKPMDRVQLMRYAIHVPILGLGLVCPHDVPSGCLRLELSQTPTSCQRPEPNAAYYGSCYGCSTEGARLNMNEMTFTHR